MTDENYYEVLGLGPEAELDDIRRAYRREIAKVHPDKPGGDAERVRLVEEARRVLLDPVARAEHDARLVGSDLIEETVAAITGVGVRALDRLSVTMQARGRDLLGSLQERLLSAARSRHRK